MLKVIVTKEAIYDMVKASEYISLNFGERRSIKYRKYINEELDALSTYATIYASTGLEYRGYTIYKKPFSPSIIFWVVAEDGVHVLRILREEYDWQRFFETHQDYEYNYPDDYVID